MPETPEEKLLLERLAEAERSAPADYPDWRRGVRWSVVGAFFGMLPGLFAGWLLPLLGNGRGAPFSWRIAGGIVGLVWLAALLIGAFRPQRGFR